MSALGRQPVDSPDEFERQVDEVREWFDGRVSRDSSGSILHAMSRNSGGRFARTTPSQKRPRTLSIRGCANFFAQGSGSRPSAPIHRGRLSQ